MTAHAPAPRNSAAVTPQTVPEAELLTVAPLGVRAQVPWFFAWVAVGVGLALAVTALGIFAVPLALLVAVLLIVFRHADSSAFGVLAGVGLLSLYVAYVQRQGPGTAYWHTAKASGSEQYLDPRPWLAAGVLLVAAGIGAFVWRRRRLTSPRRPPLPRPDPRARQEPDRE
ncbi:MAG TPA: hypothetical protein VFD50_03735 [Thermoleophilia bacterium]|nr:hypothetical protein [Thermoleophilia bacterium]